MSLECKINIDLDKGIIDFSKENIDEKVNIQEYIEKIVKSVAENEELYFDEIAVSITSASKEEIKNINKEIQVFKKMQFIIAWMTEKTTYIEKPISPNLVNT